MDNKDIPQEAMPIIQAFLAQMSSVMKISEILADHNSKDKEITPDDIIGGLVYRLMVPMTDIEIQESLDTADDIMEGSSDEEDCDDIEIIEDEDSVTERRQGKVQVNDCNCDVCKKIRE